MRKAYEANAHQTLWMTRELVRVVAHLQNRGIEALPYKGPALAQTLYGDVASRQFSDLDLLVRAIDVARAKRALIDLGYEPELRLSSREERAHLKTGYDYKFRGPLNKNLLELKWNILPRFYSVDFDIESLLTRAVEIDVGGTPLRTLHPEDLMLVLCVHAAKHAWVQLSWLCDISQLAEHEEIDWSQLLCRAQQLGVERIVAVTFSLAKRVLGTPNPPLIKANADAEKLAASVIPIIVGRTPINPDSPRYFHLMMNVRERMRDRLRFLWRLASTPSVAEWNSLRLPHQLFALYGLVRVFRLGQRLLGYGRMPHGCAINLQNHIPDTVCEPISSNR
jgi:hypothetical protein